VYGKLFVQMYDGSLRQDWQALVTFQQFIVLSDVEGVLDMTPEALSGRTGIPLEIIHRGIECLEAPDRLSRTPDEGGRRIVRLSNARPWGWRIVNYKAYRDLFNQLDRRTYHREWHRTHRGKGSKAQESPTSLDTSQQHSTGLDKTQGQGEGEAEGKLPSRKRRFKRPEPEAWPRLVESLKLYRDGTQEIVLGWLAKLSPEKAESWCTGFVNWIEGRGYTGGRKCQPWAIVRVCEDWEMIEGRTLSAAFFRSCCERIIREEQKVKGRGTGKTELASIQAAEEFVNDE
jgi:hypothetical protein